MAEKVKTAKAPAAPRKTAAKKKAAAPQPIDRTEIQKPVEQAATQAQPVSHQTSEPRPVQHDDIRLLAHRYWSERGHPHGDADADWFRAEQELRGKAS